jgi:hypothetical protein
MNGISADNFTVRWQGQILPQYDEAYTIYAKADDNVRVWIDDPTDSVAPQLIVRRWGSSNSNEYKSNPIALKAGRKYNLQIDMRERTGNATAVLSWSSASVSKRVIPSANLFTYASGTAPAVYNDPSGESSSPTIGSTTGVTALTATSPSAPSKAAQAVFSSASLNDYLRGLLK